MGTSITGKEVPAMAVPIESVAEQQCRVLAFAIRAILEPPAASPEPSREELAHAVTALRAENRALRAEVQALERQLYPDEAELTALARRHAPHLAVTPTREPDEI